MNNNDNNNNQNNNYVNPEKVNLNNANLNQASDILNRERTNIVSATLQANNAINETEVTTVNNAIKVKKKNPFINALIIIVCLLIGGTLVFFVTKYAIKYINGGESEKTTKPTTEFNLHSRVETYLNDFTHVRKFENSERIIILLPSNYDLVNNNNYYLSINRNSESIINEEYGTYTINGDVLVLNESQENFVITEGGISSNDRILNIFDSEYKYYYFNDGVKAHLLLINGTLKAETSLYLTSSNGVTNVSINRFNETIESITLNSGETFIKSGENVSINDLNLTLAS